MRLAPALLIGLTLTAPALARDGAEPPAVSSLQRADWPGVVDIHRPRPADLLVSSPSNESEPAKALAAPRAPWLTEARRHLGRDGRLVGMSRLWCARFMNFVLRRTGHRGTGSDLARSFLALPRVKPQIGAIAVLSRGRSGGHVGVVERITKRGVVLVSGNHNRRVARGIYPRARIIAFVMPRGRGS